MSRARMALVVVALGAACAGLARDARSAQTPRFGTLPEGEVGFVPDAKLAPSRVGAGERAPGFFVAQPPKAQLLQFNRARSASLVFLFSSAKDAAEMSGSKGFGAQGTDTATCFTTADRAEMFARRAGAPAGGEPAPIEWPSWFEARPTVRSGSGAALRKKPRVAATVGPVMAVHSEKLVRGADGGATLEMADAWVDAETLGTRLIGTRSLPLVRIATAPSGIEVYAARSRDEVEVVVTGTRAGEALDPSMRPFARQFARLNASLGESRTANSDCGHIRIALHPDAEKGTPMSVVQTVALLPALDPEKGEPVPSPREQDPPRVATAQMEAFKAVQAMRKRPVSVSLSATKTSADAEPVLSVAVGWAGREERR